MARYRYPRHLLGPTRIATPKAVPDLRPALADIEEGLQADRLDRARRGARTLVTSLSTTYRIPPITLAVYDRPRPSLRGRRYSGELHGDYTPPGRIRIWARTAKRHQRVAFLTFLDTLLHEFLHHYDLTYLKMEDTVHSENFYKRLGSLRHLVRPKQQTEAAPAPFEAGLSFEPIRSALDTTREPRASKSPRPDEEQPTLPFG